MKAWRRAFLYVTRKTGKMVLLLVLFLTIMTLVLVDTAISQASEGTAARLREEIGGYFKVATDYQKMDILQTVDQSLIDQVMQIDGIKAYNAMATYCLTVPELVLKAGKFSMEADSKAQMARLLGNSDSALNEYFMLDLFHLQEGRHIAPSDVGKALVSGELAQINSLEVGDSFSVAITEDDNPGSSASGTTFQLEVAGIFEEMQAEGSSADTPECDLQANFIFIDSATSQAIGSALQEKKEIDFNGGAAFFAKDPKNLDNITKQAEKLKGINWESLKLTVNNTAYQKSVEPLERLSGITSLASWLIMAISIVLLSLLLALWERDRIHEAGVLMSFGISKKNIFWQHFLECAAVFLLAFCLSIGVSYPLAGQIGKRLYNDSVVKTEQRLEEETSFSFDRPIDMDVVDVDVQLNMELNPPAVLAAGGMGLLIVALSAGLSFLVIVRCRPKELLTVME